MYAVLSSGGKQYRVEAGSTLELERLAAEPGASVTFDRVLLVGDGDEVSIGTPTVAGASVSATVLGEALGPKLVIFKFKQKVKYRRKNGHRQHLTRVRIDAINASGKQSRRAETPAASGEAAAAPARSRAKATKPKAAAAAKRGAKAPAGADAEAKPRARRTTKKAAADRAEET